MKYHEGMINARDGVCRPFDSQASGTVTGDGLGMLLLKRLDDALADRDCIYGVIKGSAVNNDGNKKIRLYRAECDRAINGNPHQFAPCRF